MLNKISKKVLSLICVLALVLTAVMAVPFITSAEGEASTAPTTLDVASPVTHARDSARNYKYQTTTETDGAQSVYQLNCPATSYTSYFIPALDTTGTAYNGVELEPNTYYLVSFKYKVANIPENKSVYLGIGRVGAERMSTDGVYVYADLGKVRKFDSTTAYNDDKTNLITLSAVQNEYAEYKLLFKTKESLETVSNSLYNDLIIITASTGGSSDRFAYKINVKDLIVKKANALETVEVLDKGNAVSTTVSGMNGEKFTVNELPEIDDSLDYYADEARTIIFTEGTFGTTNKVYVGNEYKEEKFVTTLDLFYSDYSDAITTSIGIPSYNPTNRQFVPRDSGDAEYGTVMKYQVSYYSTGAIYLGNRYNVNETANLTQRVFDNAIKVKAGETYKVNFDYYTTADAPSSSNEMLYLTAGQTVASGESYKINADTTNGVLIRSYEKDVVPADAGVWQNLTYTITFPEGYDTKTYPYLMIYVSGGKTNAIYVDNINVQRIEKTTEQVLSYNDFETAKTAPDVWTWCDLIRDFRPAVDPLNADNIIMLTSKSLVEESSFILGPSYSNNIEAVVSANNTIKVVAGESYRIRFDYYVPQNFEEVAKVGIKIRANESRPASQGQFPAFEGPSFEIINFEAGTGMTDGWKSMVYDLTIPTDADLSNDNNVMALYATIGESGKKIYFDDVKVSRVLGKETLGAVADKVVADIDLNHSYELYEFNKKITGDFYTANDPFDATNKSLMLDKARYGAAQAAQIVLGAPANWYPYEHTTAIKEAVTVKPVAGAAYKVEFDWYSTGASKAGVVTAHLAAGKTDTTCVEISPNLTKDSSSYKSEVLWAQDENQAYGSWQKVDTIVTIPNDALIANDDILVLYFNEPIDNDSPVVYFDNIKVTEIAPVMVEYNVVGKSSANAEYSNGLIATNKYAAIDGKAVMWFADKEMSKPMNIAAWDSKYFETVKLYGKYEDATTALVIGDLGGDNKVDVTDIAKFKKYFLDVEEITSMLRADATGDKELTLKDIIKLKYLVADSYKDDFNIGGVALEGASIVTPDADANFTAAVGEYVSSNFTANGQDAQIIIGDADDYAKAMVLDANAYEITLVGNKLYVNGGSEKALMAAIYALENKIALGESLSEGCILSFTYLG